MNGNVDKEGQIGNNDGENQMEKIAVVLGKGGADKMVDKWG